MKSKILLFAVCLMSSATTTFAQTSAITTIDKTTRYGAQAEAFAQTPFSSGSSVGVFGNITYQYDGEKFSQNSAHQLEGIGGLSVALGSDAMIALGGGYKQNFTYERGQPVAYLGVYLQPVSVTGKILFSQFSGYSNNYEIAAMVYPGGQDSNDGQFGVGLFYNTEYNCNVFGLKVGFRLFEGGSGGGRARGSGPCRGCRR